jgi:hypothetical protein
MRPELLEIVASLLARSRERGAVDLDELGDALGSLAVSHDEIDAMIARFEASGGVLGAPSGGGGTGRLRVVLGAARELSRSLGRAPSPDEIAARTGMAPALVRQALALGRVMGR